MPHYYLGPLVWRTSPRPSWGSPGGDGVRLDLRPRDGRVAQGGSPIGVGFLETAERLVDESGHDYLGNDLSASVTGSARNSWRRALGLSVTPSATILRDLLWEVLTVHADPAGIDRHGPLMPGRQGIARLEPTGVQRRIVPGDAEWANVQDRLQRDYRAIRERALAGQGAADLHRKYLTTLLRKFRLSVDDRGLFIPSDLPDELPVEPATTHTESFNQADSSTLGPDLTWTEVANNLETVSNQVTTVDGQDSLDCVARAEADVSGDDHYGQLVVTALGTVGGNDGFAGVSCRFSSSAHTCYTLFYVDAGAANRTQLYRVEAGSYTQLGSNVAQTPSLPDSIRVEADGSTISGYFNPPSTASHTETDTNITGHLRGGIDLVSPGDASKSAGDDFEISDLAAGGGQVFMAVAVAGM